MATELLEVELEFSKDLASKCSGLVSRLEDEAATEATECNPDKCVLLGTILSKNLRLSFRKFCNKHKKIRVSTKNDNYSTFWDTLIFALVDTLKSTICTESGCQLKSKIRVSTKMENLPGLQSMRLQ